MSGDEITPAPVKVAPDADPSSGAAQDNLKGPYAITQVNESIQREQHGLGPFVSKKGHKGDEVVYDHGAEPQRHFRLLSLSKSLVSKRKRESETRLTCAIVGLAYAILNSWTAMATSLSIALPSGGPTAVVWGLIVSFLGNLAMSASLAEM